MKEAYSTDEIRAAEARVMAVVGDSALMQHAASGLAVACGRRLRARRGGVAGSRLLVAVGPGNNGGDGLYAAERLMRRGVRAYAWRVLGSAHEEGWATFERAGGLEVDLETAIGLLPVVDQVVDGVFGIGGREGISGELARFAEACDEAGSDVVAVDLPSGLGVETARSAAPVFRAGLTVTFGAWKPSLLVEPAAGDAGEVEFVDIGLSPQHPLLRRWDAADVARAWPFPGPTDDKYARGVLGADVGSDTYPGAALLATGGAAYSGAGMIRFLGSDRAAERIGAAFPNVVFGEGRCQAYLVGCGWGERPDGAAALARRLETGLPVVVDADGLRYLPERLRPDCLLTPHAGELARLLGMERAEVETKPLDAVRAAADRYECCVLLKGATQYAARPGSPTVEVAVPGPAWTAQAGSGDTLAGMCGTLLAAGLPAERAAVLAASVQAISARNLPGPYPPQVLARHFPETIAELELLAEEEQR